MIRILTPKQTRELDAATIASEPIASIDLMERACRAFVGWFTERFDATKKVGVVCGPGNNGGDGLGIARLLDDWGYTVKVWVVRGPGQQTADFKTNLERLGPRIEKYEIVTESDRGLFSDRDILIDAIFGSGLSRPTEGIYAQTIQCINDTDAVRVAVDIPSGLAADKHSEGKIVKADYTVSFQLPKLAFLLPQYVGYVGQWTCVDIGLNKKSLRDVDTPYFMLSGKDIKKRLRLRSRFDHKGTNGHALLVAGSYGKMGAAILSATAALRAGLGLLTVHIPRNGYVIIQTAVPEAMASIDLHDEWTSAIPATENFDAVGFGPGTGRAKETIDAFRMLLNNFRKPIVIDADGLNMLAENRELLHIVSPGSILTPHPKEFERIVGKWSNDFERLEKQKALAVQLASVVILKGANTSIATPEGIVYFNSTGNPGMATGGSGDVLTGILTALMAQHYTSEEAAIIGVYLHGLAGDLAAMENGMDSLIASDLVSKLPLAFLRVR